MLHGRSVDNAWRWVRIPLSVLNPAAERFVGIEIQSLNRQSFFVDDIRIEGDPPALSFPLAQYTRSTGPLSAIFDHDSGTPGYAASRNRSAVAFSGERGDFQQYPDDPESFNQVNLQPFLQQAGVKYVGVSRHGTTYLEYDGHISVHISVPVGTAVYAMDSGNVIAEPTGNLEWPSDRSACTSHGRIRIQHDNGYVTWYQHLQRQAGETNVSTLWTERGDRPQRLHRLRLERVVSRRRTKTRPDRSMSTIADERRLCFRDNSGSARCHCISGVSPPTDHAVFGTAIIVALLCRPETVSLYPSRPMPPAPGNPREIPFYLVVLHPARRRPAGAGV